MWPKLIGTALGFVPDVLKRFFVDKDKVEDNTHSEQMGVQQEFASEFTAPEKTGLFNSFVDGVNRLVRPSFTFGVAALFVWCVVDPISFTAAMIALQAVPEMLWYIFLTIVGFWFGGRMIEGMQLGKTSKVQIGQIMKEIQQVKALASPAQLAPVNTAAQVDMDRRVADATNVAPITNEEYHQELADTSKLMSLPAILEWNRRRQQQTAQ